MPALRASGPHPGHADQPTLYGRFVVSCELEAAIIWPHALREEHRAGLMRTRGQPAG